MALPFSVCSAINPPFARKKGRWSRRQTNALSLANKPFANSLQYAGLKDFQHFFLSPSC
jgi:hypothetical protein